MVCKGIPLAPGEREDKSSQVSYRYTDITEWKKQTHLRTEAWSSHVTDQG